MTFSDLKCGWERDDATIHWLSQILLLSCKEFDAHSTKLFIVAMMLTPIATYDPAWIHKIKLPFNVSIVSCSRSNDFQLEHQDCYNPLLVKSGFHEVLSLMSQSSSRRGSSRPQGRGRGTSKPAYQPSVQVTKLWVTKFCSEVLFYSRHLLHQLLVGVVAIGVLVGVAEAALVVGGAWEPAGEVSTKGT